MPDFSFEISIPTDNDGFFLLQCPLCGEMFKLRPGDYEEETVLEVGCPKCAIRSESYLTEEVAKLAMAKMQNTLSDTFHKEAKKAERQSRNNSIKVKAGSQPRHEHEPTLMPSWDSLSETVCEDCGRPIKITPALIFSVYTCPYCGVSNFNDR